MNREIMNREIMIKYIQNSLPISTEELQKMDTDSIRTLYVLNGGSGSGNFGHSGRPGEIGGSGDSNSSISTGGLTFKSKTVDAADLSHNKIFMDYRDRAEVKEAFDQPEQKYIAKLQDKEKTALLEYSSFGSELNAKLRDGGELTDETKALDSAIEKGKMPYNAKVSRFVIIDSQSDLHELAGKTISDPGYISTSLERDTYRSLAEDARNMVEGSKIARFDIMVRKGSQVALLGGLSGVDSASEVLLPRNAELHVKRVYTSKREIIVEAYYGK